MHKPAQARAEARRDAFGAPARKGAGDDVEDARLRRGREQEGGSEEQGELAGVDHGAL
nr:hypothetical protein [Rubellimicrobium rubrum]